MILLYYLLHVLGVNQYGAGLGAGKPPKPGTNFGFLPLLCPDCGNISTHMATFSLICYGISDSCARARMVGFTSAVHPQLLFPQSDHWRIKLKSQEITEPRCSPWRQITVRSSILLTDFRMPAVCRQNNALEIFLYDIGRAEKAVF